MDIRVADLPNGNKIIQGSEQVKYVGGDNIECSVGIVVCTVYSVPEEYKNRVKAWINKTNFAFSNTEVDFVSIKGEV